MAGCWWRLKKDNGSQYRNICMAGETDCETFRKVNKAIQVGSWATGWLSREETGRVKLSGNVYIFIVPQLLSL